MGELRVFIADDHELVRYALRGLLEGEPGIVVCGEAATGDEVIDGVCDAAPDVLLLDLRMPGPGGVEVCRAVKDLCPGVHVLVLTSFDDEDELFGVLRAGASGYLLKDSPPSHVAQAVRSVADDQVVLDSSIAGRVISGTPPRSAVDESAAAAIREMLSQRELEVLALMARGMSNKEIGRALWIGETTVKTHVSHILRKLDRADRTQAVLAAVRLGIVSMSAE
ncbi:MAG: response regulator transcription factor [Clostridiales bacterium]|nr:response regulator transcription factor [Clostridiales bacterium]